MLPLLAGAASLGGALASALPTAASRDNAAQIKKLKRRQGLSGPEQNALYNAQMAPTRAVTTQLGNEYAAAAGRGGNSTADLANIRRETQTAVGDAARTAGDRVAQADMQRKLTDQAELQQRLAARAQRTSDIIGGIGGALTDVADVEGQVKGEVPLDIYDKSVENKGPLAKAGQFFGALAKGQDPRAAKPVQASAPAPPDVNELPEDVTDADLAALETGTYNRSRYMPRARRGV